MNKKILPLALLCVLLCLSACAAPASLPEPAPLPTPTPAPEGLERCVGKEVRAACLAVENSSFAAGALAQAGKLSLSLTLIKDAAAAQGYDILIADATAFSQLSAAPDLPSVFFTQSTALAPAARRSILYYNAKDEAEAALNAMLHYPSHDTPVRLLGLFSSPQSPGALAYAAMLAEGKLQSKGAYTAIDSDGAARLWTEDTLKNIVPGVLDTIYAETPALAMEAYAALRAAQRNDAVEVCASGLTAAQIQAMCEDHFLMGVAVGPNLYEAGALAVRMGIDLLAGGTSQELELPRVCLRSSDVIALYRSGVSDSAAILAQLDTQSAKLCRTEETDYLTEYYGNEQ